MIKVNLLLSDERLSMEDLPPKDCLDSGNMPIEAKSEVICWADGSAPIDCLPVLEGPIERRELPKDIRGS